MYCLKILSITNLYKNTNYIPAKNATFDERKILQCYHIDKDTVNPISINYLLAIALVFSLKKEP